jgi:hypothetical protein
MKRFLVASTVATVGSVAAIFTVPASAAQHAPFMVGVLSSDSVLVPLALFSAEKWTAPWPNDDKPAPTSAATIPQSWWTGFSASGWKVALPQSERPLRILNPVKIQSGCQNVVALKTDYLNSPPVGDARYEHRIGIAATGSVVIRFVKALDINGPKDDDWRAGEQKLHDVLVFMKRPTQGLLTQVVARIPREDGTDVWEIEAVANKRFVRLWMSDAKSEKFVMVNDAAAEADHEMVGSLTPLGAIWGLDRLTVLAWDQGFDGGRYAIIRIAAEGIDWAISAGGGSC